MNKIDFVNLNPEELDENEIVQTGGGSLTLLLVAVGGYLGMQIAGSPNASYNAFMRGWNSI